MTDLSLQRKLPFMRLIIFAFVFIFQGSDLPELNQEIVTYVNTVIGKKVDRGECWDLAYQALERSRAKWNGVYVYGKSYDPVKTKVLPGDIIQFENVQIKYQKGNNIYTESMEHHTAIVTEVNGPTTFEIAHQNNSFSGRKVGLSTLELNYVKKGKLYFYRPER